MNKAMRSCPCRTAKALLACPYCGAKGACKKRGSYERSLATFPDGKPEVLRLKIPRVQCPCGKSHALLPDFIVPYFSYSLPMILMLLSDYFHRRLSIRGICEKYDMHMNVAAVVMPVRVGAYKGLVSGEMLFTKLLA